MEQEEPTRNPDGTFPKGRSGNPKGRRKAHQDAAPLPIPEQTLLPGAHHDGWFSNTTGIGTQVYDKRLGHRQAPVRISYQEAILIWSTDDLGRRAIQDPIEDCFRQGYDFDIPDDGGDYIDLKVNVLQRMQELKVDEHVEKAMCMERALGGSALLIGFKDHKPLSAPCDPKKAHGIDWLTLLEPIELQPYSYYKDPTSEKYGEPETYQLNAFTSVGEFNSSLQTTDRSPPPDRIIHESRLIVFPGIRVSRYQFLSQTAGALWGESMLTSFYEPLRDLNVAYHAAAILATDVGQPAISIEGLMALVAKNPKALRDRMLALENGRSTARVILLDSKEKLERQGSDAIAGVPELLNALAIRFSASIPMPLSRLLGQAPKALGNESDSETRFYYDDLRGTQRRKIGPILKRIAGPLMQSFRKRKLPKFWDIKFNDLTQLTDAEMAEAHLTQARTDSMNIKSGMLHPDEARRSRWHGGFSFRTHVNESEKAPGFVAIPPHGTPGSPQNPPGGPGGVGATAHAVKSYTRKNPTSSGTEPAAKQGGDKSPTTRDAFLQDALEKARIAWDALSPGDGPGEHLTFAGLPIVVENAAGSTRTWVCEDGSSGSTLMKYDYGYVDGATGSDGDCVDVYLGPDEGAKWVYVVHQNKGLSFEEYDEDKALLGFPSADAATTAYVSQYDNEQFFGGMSQMTVEAFKKKIFQQAGKVTNDAGTESLA